jgi:hypothetical protein
MMKSLPYLVRCVRTILEATFGIHIAALDKLIHVSDLESADGIHSKLISFGV